MKSGLLKEVMEQLDKPMSAWRALTYPWLVQIRTEFGHVCDVCNAPARYREEGGPLDELLLCKVCVTTLRKKVDMEDAKAKKQGKGPMTCEKFVETVLAPYAVHVFSRTPRKDGLEWLESAIYVGYLRKIVGKTGENDLRR